MHLLAIDDLVIDAANFVQRPLLTARSDRLGFGVRRRDGVEGSVFFGGTVEPATWNVVFTCRDLETRDAVLAVLGGDVRAPRRLLAQRLDAAQTRVVSLAAPRKIRTPNTLDLEVDFEADDSVWQAEAVTTTVKSFTSPLDQAVRLRVPGNTRTLPLLRLKPLGARTSPTAVAGWGYRRRYLVTNTAPVPLWRYPLRISLGDTTPLTPSKAQVSGNDVRVWIDGEERPRTLVAWDTAASYLWLIIEALAPGDTMAVDVVYGNPAAAAVPSLDYPDRPPFTLSLSSNTVWEYPWDDLAGNAGLGLWYLSNSTLAAVADFSVPGAWRPLLTLNNPDNADYHYQITRDNFDAGGSTFTAWYQARLSVWRGAAGGYADDATVQRQTAGNQSDGIGVYHPFGIASFVFGYKYWNSAFTGAVDHTISLVGLGRNSAAEDWGVLYERSDQVPSVTTVAPVTITPAAPVTHLAIALWPTNRVEIPQNTNGAAAVIGDSTCRLTLAGAPTITGGAEEPIYEFATELRLGGGASGVAPYHALLVGNARGEDGPGAPRLAVRLTELLEIDADRRSHLVWTSDLASVVEAAPTYAVQARAAQEVNGATVEFPDTPWLAMGPSRTRVPNGDFATGLGGWEAAAATSGLTAAANWDGGVGGELAGSLRVVVGPNTAGAGASVAVRHPTVFATGGLAAIQLAAWSRSSTASLIPLRELRFYRDPDGTTLLATLLEPAWTPLAGADVRRVFAARVPPHATCYRVGLVVQTAAPSATGTVWVDDVTLNDTDLIVADQGGPNVELTALLGGRWL